MLCDCTRAATSRAEADRMHTAWGCYRGGASWQRCLVQVQGAPSARSRVATSPLLARRCRSAWAHSPNIRVARSPPLSQVSRPGLHVAQGLQVLAVGARSWRSPPAPCSRWSACRRYAKEPRFLRCARPSAQTPAANRVTPSAGWPWSAMPSSRVLESASQARSRAPSWERRRSCSMLLPRGRLKSLRRCCNLPPGSRRSRDVWSESCCLHTP
mmetsp:Transcript_118933/g.253720  ORF Transcript_118933/g.253720 Transcript_118933/m.253720 type:complete len:213 (+) Transcript_118933:43-681(+)